MNSIKKKHPLCVVFLLVSTIVYTQTRPAPSQSSGQTPVQQVSLPRVGILPISGILQEDGENIARLLSNEPEMRSVFTVVIPQISLGNTLTTEPEATGWSLVDGDVISAISKQLNLDFVIISHIQQLGSRYVIIMTLIKVHTLQLVAGSYRGFHTIGDIRILLPELVKKIVEASRFDTSKASRLAVLPFELSPDEEISPQDATVLLQFLMIDIANTGKYAVLPRTKTNKTVLSILQTVLQELPDANTIQALASSINAQCVLLGKVIRFEPERSLFFSQILGLEAITLRSGAVVESRNVTDGFHLMSELSFQLTGVHSGMSQVFISDIMVWVSGGTFSMGSGENERDEQPVHTVHISSFYLGKTPVTQKEYEAVMGSNPSSHKGELLPVVNVSWYDAVEYCNKLSVKEGLTPAYSGSNDQIVCNFTANGYRLPTEAEWEYAAKSGNRDSLSFEYAGGNNPDILGWYAENSDNQPHEVGTKTPNSAGLYDMSGNVWEWCWDWYGLYQPESQQDPVGPNTGRERVTRGGSWYSSAEILRSTYRNKGNPRNRYGDLGFRVLRPVF
ncbi:MAG: formylglycine-generating enzyme family protein [Treponema sp.]|nr:formylglycine-generating enzyme family protein [Treponema sp.]